MLSIHGDEWCAREANIAAEGLGLVDVQSIEVLPDRCFVSPVNLAVVGVEFDDLDFPVLVPVDQGISSAV
jgi:hypothetical protein